MAEIRKAVATIQKGMVTFTNTVNDKANHCARSRTTAFLQVQFPCPVRLGLNTFGNF